MLSTAALVFLTNIAKTISALVVYLYYQDGTGDASGGSFGAHFPPIKLIYALPATLYAFSDNIAFTVLTKVELPDGT